MWSIFCWYAAELAYASRWASVFLCAVDMFSSGALALFTCFTIFSRSPISTSGYAMTMGSLLYVANKNIIPTDAIDCHRRLLVLVHVIVQNAQRDGVNVLDSQQPFHLIGISRMMWMESTAYGSVNRTLRDSYQRPYSFEWYAPLIEKKVLEQFCLLQFIAEISNRFFKKTYLKKRKVVNGRIKNTGENGNKKYYRQAKMLYRLNDFNRYIHYHWSVYMDIS